jgi:uncharacterized protein YndB with AHSA1/START domain
MSAIHLVQHYPHDVRTVWRAITDPELVPRWTVTGAGGRPVGFDTVPGTKFQLVAKPKPGWDGVVNCELLEATEPTVLRYTWTDSSGGGETVVTWRLDPDGPDGTGTRLTYDHAGFTGAGGFFMAKLLARVRRKMLRAGLPPVLDSITAPAGKTTPKP